MREKLIDIITAFADFLPWETIDGIADGIIADGFTLPVHCKECKYWDGDRRCNGRKNGLVMEYTDNDDFCSYGERKDNGTT